MRTTETVQQISGSLVEEDDDVGGEEEGRQATMTGGPIVGGTVQAKKSRKARRERSWTLRGLLTEAGRLRRQSCVKVNCSQRCGGVMMVIFEYCTVE